MVFVYCQAIFWWMREAMSWLKKLGLGLSRGKAQDEGEGRRDRERAEVKLPFALEVGDNKYRKSKSSCNYYSNSNKSE